MHVNGAGACRLGRVRTMRPATLLARSPLLLAMTASSITSVPNFRDLGFTPCAAGIVKPGILYRSSTPCNISEEDACTLANLCTVLDLRTECDAQKDGGLRRLSPITIHLPLLNEDMMRHAMIDRARGMPLIFARVISLGMLKRCSPSRRLRTRIGAAVDACLASLFDTVELTDVYWLIVTESPAKLRLAFELAASSEALPILVHCTHGKDRTGVLVALLLRAIGVSEEDVVADYVVSHAFGCSTEGQIAMWQSFPERLRPYLREGLIEDWCCAPEDALRQTLHRIDKCVQVIIIACKLSMRTPPRCCRLPNAFLDSCQGIRLSLRIPRFHWCRCQLSSTCC